MNLVHKIFLYRHSLKILPTIEPLTGCEIVLLSEAELPRLHEIWPVRLDEMRVRLQRGDLCFVACINGAAVHYSWVQFTGKHNIRDVGQAFDIAPNDAWVYHCRTAEWAKGKGIYPFVLGHILSLCAQRACHRVWIYTTSENLASQRGILKAGFSFYKQLTALQLFGWNFPLARV